MLELSGITKRYGRSFALESLDLSLGAHQTTVLIGPSGCGKSTLLRIMIGLVQSDAGSVRVLGNELTPNNILSIRRDMGYVIQEGGLFPHLTGKQNVTLMAEQLGWGERQIEKRLSQLSDLVHLDAAKLSRFPSELSGGERQRVSLMRALMLDPQILLLDEPLGALDPIIRASLQRDLIDIFAKLNKTVVMVTHDLGEAVQFAAEIILMRNGKIVQRGAIGDLVESPADPFVSQFISAQTSPLHGLLQSSQDRP